MEKVKLLYSNVRVIDNDATVELVLNAQEGLLTPAVINELQQRIVTRSKKEHGIDDVTINISVIPNQIFKYNFSERPQP